MIIEDVGEPKNGIGKYLKNYKRLQIVFTKNGSTERVGDYTNDERFFLIERKEAFDFMNSVIDDRFYTQLWKMREYFDGPKYVIFEGSWDALMKVAGRKRSGIVAKLTAAKIRTATMGVCWLESKNKEDTAKLIKQIDAWTKPFEIRLGSKVNKTERITYTDRKGNKKHKIIRLEDDKIIALGYLVGIKRAKSLLEKFRSVEKILEVIKNNKKELLSIKGIGPKTVQTLEDFFIKEVPKDVGRLQEKSQKDKKGNKPKVSKVRKRQKQKFARDRYTYGKWKDHYSDESS